MKMEKEIAGILVSLGILMFILGLVFTPAITALNTDSQHLVTQAEGENTAVKPPLYSEVTNVDNGSAEIALRDDDNKLSEQQVVQEGNRTRYILDNEIIYVTPKNLEVHPEPTFSTTNVTYESNSLADDEMLVTYDANYDQVQLVVTQGGTEYYNETHFNDRGEDIVVVTESDGSFSDGDTFTIEYTVTNSQTGEYVVRNQTHDWGDTSTTSDSSLIQEEYEPSQLVIQYTVPDTYGWHPIAASIYSGLPILGGVLALLGIGALVIRVGDFQ